MTVKVLDVSSHQNTTFPLTGIDGVIVKATEGTSYVNPKHDAQVSFARAHGQVVGHYHYAHDGNIHGQVDYFLKHSKVHSTDILALDWEEPKVSNAEKDDFLAYLDNRVQNRVILYCNTNYWFNHDDTSRCGDGLWIATYNGKPGNPGIKHPWLLHQYDDSPIDISLGNWKNRAAMAAWAAHGVGAGAPGLPHVSLAHVEKAFRTDPQARQGHVTYPYDIKLVEHALVKVGVMHQSKYAMDGSAGTLSVAAYSEWQKRYSREHHLGWKGADVNGIPGMTSLKALGARSDLFTVTH